MITKIVLSFVIVLAIIIFAVWRRKRRRPNKKRVAFTPVPLTRRAYPTSRTAAPPPTVNPRVLEFLGYCQKGKTLGIVLLFPGPVRNIIHLSIVTTGDYKSGGEIPPELQKKLHESKAMMNYDHSSEGHQALLVACSVAEIELANMEFGRTQELSVGFRCFLNFLKTQMRAPEVEELVLKVLGAIANNPDLGGVLSLADTGKGGGFLTAALSYIYNTAAHRPLTRVSVYAMPAAAPEYIDKANRAVKAVEVKSMVRPVIVPCPPRTRR